MLLTSVSVSVGLDLVFFDLVDFFDFFLDLPPWCSFCFNDFKISINSSDNSSFSSPAVWVECSDILSKWLPPFKFSVSDVNKLSETDYEYIDHYLLPHINIKSFDKKENNIIYILHKMYKLNIIENNKTINFINNIDGVIEYAIFTKVEDVNSSYYICHEAINRCINFTWMLNYLIQPY